MSMQLNLLDMNEDGQVECSIQRLLFWVEKDIPKLEELPLNSDDIEMVGHFQVSRSLYHETKVLSVHCYLDNLLLSQRKFL